MFLESAYPDANDRETALRQGTNILLADVASLLVVDNCSTHSYNIRM